MDLGRTSGSRPAKTPRAGTNAQTLYTNETLVWSATQPSNNAQMPAKPKARPKNKPEISPTRPGTRSCAYTSIAENADARMTPITALSTPVQNRLAYGSNTENGNTPRIDHQITRLRPIASPTGPP